MCEWSFHYKHLVHQYLTELCRACRAGHRYTNCVRKCRGDGRGNCGHQCALHAVGHQEGCFWLVAGVALR